MSTNSKHQRICPWWIGYFLINPLRRLWYNPVKILSPYIEKNMTILEIGPGMGFFSIPLAELTGNAGKVISIDLQEKMLKTLKKRAKKKKLDNIIETRLCSEISLGIDDMVEKIDFVFAFAVMHEIFDKKQLFSEVFRAMKQGAKMLISEPTNHESKEGFKDTISIAESKGFKVIGYFEIKHDYSVILTKK